MLENRPSKSIQEHARAVRILEPKHRDKVLNTSTKINLKNEFISEHYIL